MFSNTATIAAYTALIISFLGCLQLWLWWQDRSLVALAIWGCAHMVGTVGMVLLMGRGTLPNRLSIDVAVTCVMLSYGLVWVGARRFEGRPVSIAVAVAGALVWLVACQVPAFYLNLDYRVAGGAFLIGAYDVLVICEFARKRPDAVPRPTRRALAIVFGIEVATQVARAMVALISGFDQPVFSIPSSTKFGIPVVIGTVLAVGTSVLLIAAAKDEAERRTVAAFAMARDTADRANAAKSHFLARMSHELRTPLNGILGMAQVLVRDPVLGGEQRERAVLLEQAGRHLLALVNDILDLVRVEAGRLELTPRATLVSDIAQGGVALMAATAAAKSVALTLEVADDVPIAVRADPLRVRQILLNLLGNAIKFTPPGGQIALSVARDPASDGVCLTVTDTGPGVAADIRPYLFQDFASRPINAATSEGAGLGLAISASLARAMGGTIEYQPGPNGCGSRFTATLPLPACEAPVAAADTPPAAAAPVPGLQVLVVDDVASNRKLAKAMLEQVGFGVTLAEGGAAAVAALEAGPVPDVVLMDVYMPGVDGLMATRRIRALNSAAGRVPIIFLTADVSLDRAEAYRDVGVNGYITKPLDVGELLAAIAAAVPANAQPLSIGR